MAGPRARAHHFLRIGMWVWFALMLAVVPFLHEHLGKTSTAGWHWHLNLGKVLPAGADPVDQQLGSDSGPSDGASIGVDALLDRPAQEIPAGPVAQAIPLYLLLILALLHAASGPLAFDQSYGTPLRYRQRPGFPPRSLAPPRN